MDLIECCFKFSWTLISYASFITLVNGVKLIEYNNFTFSKSGIIRDGGARYSCSSSFSKGCKAYLHVSANNELLLAKGEHNHDPINILYDVSEWACFMTLVSGVKLIKYMDYTFSKSGNIRDGGARYSCSRKACKAYLHVSADNEILHTQCEHNHEPIRYYLSISEMNVVLRAYEDHDHNPVKYKETKRACFITLATGSVLLMYNGYTFSRGCLIRNGGSRFKCSNAMQKQCKSYIHVSLDNKILYRYCSYVKAIFITVATGAKLLLYKGYTFSKSSPRLKSLRYKCSCVDTKKCKAYVVLNLNNEIVAATDNHNHEPPRYMVTTSGVYVPKFITLTSGVKLLLYDGYTFSKAKPSEKTVRYKCSCTNSKKCKASVMLDYNDIILFASESHNHEPLSYRLTKNGTYMRQNL
ncbi:unnamed protein product [Leptidea sinapis]|uniref:FLYWCH-type domain-containing protein n=1 Tax=Leptidea sinapis TaxID=189913 RepID=A0A5E4Q0N5_9NEOP|nr:unnamed protein product [Leptidea sinapis]